MTSPESNDSEVEEVPTTGTCVSCSQPAVCTHQWPTELVPLPEGMPHGLICGDCYQSLVRYAELMA